MEQELTFSFQSLVELHEQIILPISLRTYCVSIFVLEDIIRNQWELNGIQSSIKMNIGGCPI